MKNRGYRTALIAAAVLTIGAGARAQDAIPLTGAHFERSPDISSWPITAHLTQLDFGPGNVCHVSFDAENRWPSVTPPGWNGPIQYTLWMVRQIGGQVYAAGGIEFWQGRATADPSSCGADGMPQTWFYDASWGPMATPIAQGERVGFFVAAGDQRAKDVQSVQERSAVVALAWGGAAGSRWTGEPGPPPPAPVPAPAPTPSTGPVTPGGAPPATKDDIDALVGLLGDLEAELKAHAAQSDARAAELLTAIRTAPTTGTAPSAPTSSPAVDIVKGINWTDLLVKTIPILISAITSTIAATK